MLFKPLDAEKFGANRLFQFGTRGGGGSNRVHKAPASIQSSPGAMTERGYAWLRSDWRRDLWKLVSIDHNASASEHQPRSTDWIAASISASAANCSVVFTPWDAARSLPQNSSNGTNTRHSFRRCSSKVKRRNAGLT